MHLIAMLDTTVGLPTVPDGKQEGIESSSSSRSGASLARIGLLTTSFPRYAGDISGHFVAGFARALIERGHQVDVLAPGAATSPP